MKQQDRFRDIRAVLSCRHTRGYKQQYRPEEGDQLWCFKCHVMVTVTEIQEEFRIRCANCAVTRSFGRAKLNAEIFGSRHHQKYPGHEVVLFDGVQEQHRWSAQQDKLFTESLPTDRVQPPF